MKLGNLKGANQGVDGGLRSTGREREVVAQFLSDRPIMRALANSLRQSARSTMGSEAPGNVTLDGEETLAAVEGGPRYVKAIRRERSASLRKAKLAEVTESGRRIACEVCHFDFARSYGEIGVSYIEVHHRTPLHVSDEVESSLADLALLCSNCHRMIHRHGWFTVDQLVVLWKSAQQLT